MKSDQAMAYVMNSQITHFERVVQAQKVMVEVGLELRVSNDPEQWNKHYYSSQMLETNDKHASAEAYGAALQDIIQ